MPLISISLGTEAATARYGAAIAKLLRPGDVIGLSGPLGAGKTTLARAVIRSLTEAVDAPSPTYTLVEIYKAAEFSIWHFDLYRLEKPEDIWELGFEECLDSDVALIEWPGQAGGLLPNTALNLSIELQDERRILTASGDEAWAARFRAAGIA